MVNFEILRRFYIVLLVASVASFSFGLYGANEAGKVEVSIMSVKNTESKYYRECIANKYRDDCKDNGWRDAINNLKNDVKQWRSMQFWGFVAGWVSFALIIGCVVLTWVITGKTFGKKINSSTQ